MVENKTTIAKNILRKIRNNYTIYDVNDKMLITKGESPYPYKSNNLLAWVLEDPILRASIEIKHSTICKIGYTIEGITKKDELLLKKIRFDKWLKDSWWQELIYRNSFTEINRDANNETISLAIIKTDEMDIVHKPTGEVVKYLQYPYNNDGEKFVITLPKEKIIHISINNIDTGLWGCSDIPTIIPLIKKKNIVENFLNWMFESNQFRAVLRVGTNTGEDEVDEIIENLKATMINPTKLLVLYGEDSQIQRLHEIDGFSEVLKILDYYRSQMLAILQLPPLQVGILENSNRSSSEYQIRYSFYTHIQGLLNAKADEINNEVFEALGVKGTFKYRFIDDKTRTDALATAQILANMGGDLKMINQWLIEQGMDIPNNLFDKTIEQKQEMLDNVTKNQTNENENDKPQKGNIKLDKNSNMHPSRKPTEMDFAGGSRNK